MHSSPVRAPPVRNLVEFVLVPLLLVVLGVLGWTLWSARAGRDPISSVDRFNRALTAMQPTEPVAGEPREPVGS